MSLLEAAITVFILLATIIPMIAGFLGKTTLPPGVEEFKGFTSVSIEDS